RCDQPTDRIVGSALPRPALGGDCKRVLRRLLGQLDVPEQADERGEYAPPLVPEDILEHELLFEWTDLDRAARALPLNLRSDGNRPVEVDGIQDEQPGQEIFTVDERGVGQERLAVLGASG